MVSNRQTYETGRPGFVGGAAVGAVFKSTIDCLADWSFLIPICEVFSEMKFFPACSIRDGIGVSAIGSLAALRARYNNGR